MQRKIIFLDIDGVLQPKESNERFNNMYSKDVFSKTTCKPELYEYLDYYFKIDYRPIEPYDVAAVYYDWDKTSVALLKVVLDYSHAQIVLSSDWRRYNEFDVLKKLFAIHKLDKYLIEFTSNYKYIDKDFIEKTEREFKEKNGKEAYLEARSVEILEWLNRNPDVKQWVAIDDMILSGLGKHYVRTWTRFEEEHTVNCLKVLR